MGGSRESGRKGDCHLYPLESLLHDKQNFDEEQERKQLTVLAVFFIDIFAVMNLIFLEI